MRVTVYNAGARLTSMRGKVVDPYYIATFVRCDGSTWTYVQKVRWFEISSVFPRLPYVNQNIPTMPIQRVPGHSLRTRQFSTPQDLAFIKFPLVRAQLYNNYYRETKSVSPRAQVVTFYPLFFPFFSRVLQWGWPFLLTAALFLSEAIRGGPYCSPYRFIPRLCRRTRAFSFPLRGQETNRGQMALQTYKTWHRGFPCLW